MATHASFLTFTQSAFCYGYHHREMSPRRHAALTHGSRNAMRRVLPPLLAADLFLRRSVRRSCAAARGGIPGRGARGLPRSAGNVGLLELHCAHRGTSLEFGLISERGIRCCYHGWLFGVDGTVIETPGEPAHSTLKDRLCQGAYPTHEYNGVMFGYMGPPDKQPPFPLYDCFERAGYRLIPGQKYFYPCNWLQIVENAMDPVHTAFLHTIVSGSVTANSGVPELDFTETLVA